MTVMIDEPVEIIIKCNLKITNAIPVIDKRTVLFKQCYAAKSQRKRMNDYFEVSNCGIIVTSIILNGWRCKSNIRSKHSLAS